MTIKIVGFIFSLLLLFALIINANWVDIKAQIDFIDPKYLILSVGMLFLNLLLRAKRWQLSIQADRNKVDWIKDCFSAYSIGNFLNALIPFKPGELAKPLILGQKKSLSKSYLLATVLYERMWDICCLLILVLFVLLQTDLVLKNNPIVVPICVVIVVLLGIVGLPKLVNYIENSKYQVFDKLRLNPVNALIQFSINLKSYRVIFFTPKLLTQSVLLSVLLWICAIINVYALLLAFNLNLPWTSPFLIVAMLNLGMTVPSTPGGIGLAHALYVAALTYYDIGYAKSFVFATTAHAINYLTVVFIGVISIWHEGFSWNNLRGLKGDALSSDN